jgi:hypothetical protein
MGAHWFECEGCGSRVPVYNSCNDRHCPLCQGGKRAEWLQKRTDELLPVEYFQVVFTAPEQLTALAQAQPELFYEALMQAVKDTLLEVAASPEHLGAQLGGVMVLHTWGQMLQLHPHVHVIVPGGGLSPDGQEWRSCPTGFFLPVRVLSEVFRGKLLDFLKREHQAGALRLTGGLAQLADFEAFTAWLAKCYDSGWVVYVEPPEDREPSLALKYMARYVYRVAISNDRLESIEDGQVTFRYKDYARGGVWRSLTLSADEFLRRFVQHVLPPRFVRIRSFGFLAPGHRAKKLALIRQRLGVSVCPRPSGPSSSDAPDAPDDEAGRDADPADARPRCPYCGGRALRWLSETKRPSLRVLLALLRPLPLLDGL